MEVYAFELTEARFLVESEAAALATHNITKKDIDRLKELIAQMDKGDEDLANSADQLFHLTIAEASNNAALVHTIKMSPRSAFYRQIEIMRRVCLPLTCSPLNWQMSLAQMVR